MSLPTIILSWLAASAVATIGWVLLRLCGRVARLEASRGVWLVQSPEVPSVTADAELPPLSHTTALTDAEFAELVQSYLPPLTEDEVDRVLADWRRQLGMEGAA